MVIQKENTIYITENGETIRFPQDFWHIEKECRQACWDVCSIMKSSVFLSLSAFMDTGFIEEIKDKTTELKYRFNFIESKLGIDPQKDMTKYQPQEVDIKEIYIQMLEFINLKRDFNRIERDLLKQCIDDLGKIVVKLIKGLEISGLMAIPYIITNLEDELISIDEDKIVTYIITCDNKFKKELVRCGIEIQKRIKIRDYSAEIKRLRRKFDRMVNMFSNAIKVNVEQRRNQTLDKLQLRVYQLSVIVVVLTLLQMTSISTWLPKFIVKLYYWLQIRFV